jgi:hypothetical protein
MLKKLSPYLIAFLLSGCANVDVAPKADTLAKLEANVQTQVDSFVKAAVTVKGAEIDAKLITAEARLSSNLQQDINQKIGTMKGDQNVGPFSGGAVYVTVVCVVFIVGLTVVVIFLLNSLSKWKQVVRNVGGILEDKALQDPEGVKSLRHSVNNHLKAVGLDKLVRGVFENKG